ncbi:MAG: cyclic nucleotide-binding domain-containing protein [Burkholderiales bacterium]
MGHEHAAALKGTAICRTLSDAEISAIASLAEAQKLAPGKELFREGDSGDGLYLVVSGEIDVVKRAPGNERSLARLGAGEVLGEMSLLTEDSRSATGRATVETTVLRLPAKRFRALLEQGSPAALKVVARIAEVIARRLATTNAKVIELADKLESAGSAPRKLNEQELAELHRTLQVWSF